MPNSPRNQWPYPDFKSKTWYAEFQSLVAAQDATAYANREDRSIVFTNDVQFTWTLGTNTFSWTAANLAFSTISGFRFSLNIGSAVIQEGQVIYVNLTRAPTSNGVLTPAVATSVPNTDDATVLAVRYNNKIYLRSGVSLADGETKGLFGYATSPTPILSLVKTQIGSDFDNVQTLHPDLEGTIDWFVPIDSPNSGGTYVPTYSGAITCHERLGGGGYIRRGLRVVRGGGSISAAAIASAGYKRTITSGGTDGTITDNQQMPYVNGSLVTGCGWSLTIPSSTTQQVLRVYAAHGVSTVQLKAHLTDGSAADVTDSNTSDAGSGSGTTNEFPELKYTITFASSQPASLIVTLMITAALTPNFGTNDRVGIGAITLASS